MAQSIRVPVPVWESVLAEVESVFRRPVPGQFRSGDVDGTALLQALLPPQDDAFARGKILLGHELRLFLTDLIEGSSPDIFSDSQPIAELIPPHLRRKAWADLTQSSDFQWPRLGMPVWGQTLYGLGLLMAFVLCFIFPFIGLGLFFGGIILSYRVEKWSRSFQYRTLEEVVDAAVHRSWPALQLGAADDVQMEAVLMEILTRHLPEFELGNALPVIQVDDPWARPRPQLHILNGDALRAQLAAAGFRGQAMVMRECMVVGPVAPGDDFWSRRKAFIHTAYNADAGKYDRWVGEEMAKLSHLPANAEVNLWFENDLFCQANMWFMVHELEEQGFSGPLYRIFPAGAANGDTWANFSTMEESEFLVAYGNRIAFTPADREIVERLWSAFANDAFTTLQQLAGSQSHVLQGLPEVVQAHLDRKPDANGLGRPERTLKEIQATGISAFEDVLREFTRREPIYGFGDLQVKEILERLQS